MTVRDDPGGPNAAGGWVGVSLGTIGGVVLAAVGTGDAPGPVAVLGGLLLGGGGLLACYCFADARPPALRRTAAPLPFCPYCGKPARHGGQFCPTCGNRR